VSLRAALDGADSGRQALIDKLQQAWNAGAYRPDAGRIADKLLDSGFDPLDPEVP
jgi:anti-sigma28 factor (negative regulator of flagellin synthesis)